MLKSDRWIREMGTKGMISPFEPNQVRKVAANSKDALLVGNTAYEVEDKRSVISYGTSSYGYDLRLSAKEFSVFRHIPGTIVNPKRFDRKHLQPVDLHEDEDGQFFILPGNSYGLGVAYEFTDIPLYITVVCIGKSTYARAGVIVNVTPFETRWKGYATLEFSNSSCADVRIYANEGVLQMLFLEGEPCDTTYDDRNGKYQNQPQSIVLSKV